MSFDKWPIDDRLKQIRITDPTDFYELFDEYVKQYEDNLESFKQLKIAIMKLLENGEVSENALVYVNAYSMHGSMAIRLLWPSQTSATPGHGLELNIFINNNYGDGYHYTASVYFIDKNNKLSANIADTKDLNNFKAPAWFYSELKEYVEVEEFK